MARNRKPKGVKINGWLSVDKEAGLTSTDVTNAIKRATNAQKVGHGGTLDPLATGVLPVALGEATKTVAYVMDAPKTYVFTLRFGEARDTDDAEGEAIATSEARPEDGAIRALLPEFTGEIQQTPPIFAAVKVNGERAYDLARRGEAVALEPRPVSIHALELIERLDADRARLRMRCGKGTYVRSLARDLGERLGCYGHVAELRRTEVGGFAEENAVSLATLTRVVADDSLPQLLIPLKTALAGIPALALTGPQADRLRAGQAITVQPDLLDRPVSGEEPVVRALCEDRVVALARLDDDRLRPLRVFNW